MKLLRITSKKKKQMDDGYETGPHSTLSSSTSTSKSRSPRRSLSSAAPPALVSKRSVGSGSLPSPAHITDEARRVLEAFLQRSLSIDRGSTGSVAAMVPRHLEVIEEIRHTRIRTNSYRVAREGGDSADSVDSVDGVTVRVTTESEQGPAPVITNLSLQHHHSPVHSTDVDVSLLTDDGRTRVLHTHVMHPPLTGAAEAVTTGAAEVFIDASLSRQVSHAENGIGEAVLNGLPEEIPRPSTAAYDADFEIRAMSAASGGGEKKRKKKKLSREAIRTWLRTLRKRDGDDLAPSPDEVDVDVVGAFAQGYSDYELRPVTPLRPKFHTMESTSSSTSTSTFGSGAPTRSLVHPEDKPRKKKKRRLRRRASQKPATDGSSFFHQLFRIKRFFTNSEPEIVHHSRNNSIIADILAAQQANQFNCEQTAATPDSELGMDVEDASSLPDLPSQSAKQEVGAMFRSAIEKRNSSGSGVRIEASTNALVRRLSSGGDQVDATITEGSVTKQVDRTTLRLDLSSSSNSQSSSGPSRGNSGVGQLSSPDQVGPDGVASKRDVDKVARLLDKLADEINLSFATGGDTRNRSDSAPTVSSQRRFSLPDNNPIAPSRRSRPGSARGRSAASESGDTRTVATSASTPLLDVKGEEFDPQRALKAKAHRIKHQSNECLVSETVVDRLLQCETYDQFSAQLRGWYGHSSVNWKQIALLYHLTRKLVRQLSKLEDGERQVERMKEFTMTYFQQHFAEFVIRRGGWQNVIEDTEDSELD